MALVFNCSMLPCTLPARPFYIGIFLLQNCTLVLFFYLSSSIPDLRFTHIRLMSTDIHHSQVRHVLSSHGLGAGLVPAETEVCSLHSHGLCQHRLLRP